VGSVDHPWRSISAQSLEYIKYKSPPIMPDIQSITEVTNVMMNIKNYMQQWGLSTMTEKKTKSHCALISVGTLYNVEYISR
jgi:hypothetical protein